MASNLILFCSAFLIVTSVVSGRALTEGDADREFNWSYPARSGLYRTLIPAASGSPFGGKPIIQRATLVPVPEEYAGLRPSGGFISPGSGGLGVGLGRELPLTTSATNPNPTGLLGGRQYTNQYVNPSDIPYVLNSGYSNLPGQNYGYNSNGYYVPYYTYYSVGYAPQPLVL